MVTKAGCSELLSPAPPGSSCTAAPQPLISQLSLCPALPFPPSPAAPALLLVLLHSLGLPSCGRGTHWLLAGESSPARSMSAKDGQNCDSTQGRKCGRYSCSGVRSCSHLARWPQSFIEFAQRGTGLTRGCMWGHRAGVDLLCVYWDGDGADLRTLVVTLGWSHWSG